MIEGLVMGKAKKEKAPDSSNWVPGWFGGTLLVRPSSQNVQKHLKDRIANATQDKKACLQSNFEKAKTERRFGL
jgi:hypothetical protein